MTKTLLCFCGLALLAAPLASPVVQAQTNTASRSASGHMPSPATGYGRLPLSFEPNRGQADPAVQFLSRGSHYTVLLQPQTATLLLDRTTTKRDARPLDSHRAAIRMTLSGASATATMLPERPLAGYVNYLTGDTAHSHIGLPSFAATRVTATYPGIDVVYYGTERQLEYDFVVAPESDPSQIRLAIDGAHPTLQPDGSLRLQIASATQDSDVIFQKPILYQQLDGKRQPVDGTFAIAANGEVGFQVGSYDRSRELVIDPVISYGSYYGGSAEDEINGSALNGSNQLYAVGQTFSASLPNTTGEFQTLGNAGNGGHDAFVTKLSADGSSVLWTTFLEGSGDDFATSVAVNSSDQAYVVGYTNSCQGSGDPGSSSNSVRFPFTSDAIQTLCSPNVIGFDTYESNGGNYTTFLAKLSSDGKTELYGTPIGGSSGDYASSIVLDATGRPYIVGETTSTSYNKCATVGPHCSDVPSYPVDQHGNADIGLANYPTTSNAFYSSTTEAQMYPTICTGCPGTQDEQAFLTILSADLHSFVYSSLIGGPDIGGCGNGACNTNGIAVAVNSAGQAFIGGNTSSAHWPTTAGAFSPTCSNAGAANSQCPMVGWLAGFDPTKSGAASLLFSTYMTGSSAGLDGNGNQLYPGGDVYGLATDSKGNVVATGDNNANNYPTTAGAFEPACVQFSDGNANTKRCASAFITKLSPTGATVWSTYYTPKTSPGNFVIGQGVALDANDNVFVAGTSTSPTLPLVNTFTTNGAQNDDAFLIELSPTGSSLLMGTYLGTGGGITLNNNSLHLDSNLNAYFSGSQGNNPYGGTYFPVTPNAPAKTIGGSTDGWVAKLITQQQTSTTALQITPNSGAPGTSITFTATITGVSGFAVPTGTVVLSSSATTLGTITLTNGSGTFSTNSLAAGTYNVIATYSGDIVYATSATTAQTVSIQNTPTIALTATPSTATIGTAIALKATLTSSAGTPTGTVYFMDGTSTLGSAVLSGGSASYSATSLGAGTHTLTARYSGDNSFVAGSSPAQTVTINLITPTVALSATPSSATVGTAIALSATVAGTGATPTGTVKFLDGATVLSTFTLAGTSGVATYSASALAVGTHTITAAYSGDTNFSSIASAAQTITVSAIPMTVSLSATPSSLTIKSGSTGTTVITVTPAGGYTGTLTFACGSLPTAATCSFAPATLSFTGGSAAQTTTLTFSTTSTHAMLSHPMDHLPLDRRAPVVAFASLLLLPFAIRRRSKLKGILPVLIVIGSITLFAVSGCSSSGGSTTINTPVGSYSVPVTVTGATASNTLSLQITVQ